MEVVVERMRVDLAGKIGTVVRQFRVGEGVRAGHQFTGVAVSQRARTQTVLHRGGGAAIPDVFHVAADAAVIGEVTIEISETLPRNHRRQMRRLQAGGVPLIDGVIRNSQQTDLAVAPSLRASPFDAGVHVLRFARAPRFDVTGRASPAARINADADIPVGHPAFGINHLPGLITIGRILRDLGVRLEHDVPRIGIALRKIQTLRIRAVGQNHRMLRAVGRAENIGTHHRAVIHRNRHIPIDLHHISRTKIKPDGENTGCLR